MPIINVENASIKTASVEIKTLTVNGKQVTLSVFRQIIEENILDDENFKLNGTPWATVNYFWKDDQNLSDYKIHVLWQKGSELRRCVILKKANHKDSYYLKTKKYEQIQSSIHDRKSYIKDIELTEKHYLDDKEIENCFYIKQLKWLINNTNNMIGHINDGRSNNEITKYENILKRANDRLEYVYQELAREKKELIEDCDFLKEYEIQYNKLVEPLIDLPHLFIAI